ncbi:hypothetical protein KDK77_06900, partial [bacterium]|nr:hypothetical protein [bacterium]
MNNKRLITTIIFLLISTAVIWFGFYYNVTFYGKHFAQNIPKTIDGMNSREIIMDQHTLDILETEDVLFREYRRHGEFENPLYLCIIFSENNRKVAHPPELC